MADELPPEVVAERGAELARNCRTYVNKLRVVAGVSDSQCVVDMTRVLANYGEVP